MAVDSRTGFSNTYGSQHLDTVRPHFTHRIAPATSDAEADPPASKSNLRPSAVNRHRSRRAHTASSRAIRPTSPNNFDFLRLAAALAVLLSPQEALPGLAEPVTAIGS